MDDLQYSTAMNTADFLIISMLGLMGICFIGFILLCGCTPADICEMVEDERDSHV